MSSNISPNNNSKKEKNNFSKNKIRKVNTSYSIGKNNKKIKIFNSTKTIENSFGNNNNTIRNNSALNLGINKINFKNYINLKYNELERNYKKQ